MRLTVSDFQRFAASFGRSEVAAPTETTTTTAAVSPRVQTPVGELPAFPPADQWDRWTELDAKAWPKRIEHTYTLVPTTCFNCESACGLLAYIDVETLRVRKFEGNPEHPGSRGRTCAKGPATLTQVYDPERILYPMKRAGKRGEGKWERTTWDEVLDTFAARIRKAIVEDRKTEVMYHVGRPGEDGYMERVLQSWGVDAHNSHTNICSAGGRFGYAAWMGIDRPSPDYANARFTLLISSHLEAGHYFNPHAQRIMEAKKRGAKIAVMDPRLSNTASMADYWMPTYPGSEAAVLLAMANVLIQEGHYDREFVRRWTNWDQYMRDEHPESEQTYDAFERILKTLYAEYTPEFAEKESGVAADQIVEVAHEIGRAGSAFSAHNWRAAAAGNLGGWAVARCLFFLNVLTGSVGAPGGTSPNIYDKYVPAPFKEPKRQQVWNELTWPREYPLAHHEMSFLLPHLLKEQRGKVDVYFTRVYNPVWTNPDGFSWMETLSDESMVGLHAALTPTWSETAWLADYVLPMGTGAERHDLHSYETSAGQWIGFRQPVRRVAMERLGQRVTYTYEANPGEVWEENEWWIELSWRIDPDGSLGIRQYYESPYRPGEKLTVDEYYQWIFEHSVPGLPEAAAKEGLTPLAYMRKYGAFAIRHGAARMYEDPVAAEDLAEGMIDEQTGIVWTKRPRPHSKNIVPKPAPATGERGTQVGVVVDGVARAGFPTPSGKLELYSKTLHDWKWPEYALPAYIKSHVHHEVMDTARGDFVLVPTFRLPVLVHTRSNNAKWLTEIAHSNPVWMHPSDAARLRLATGDLVRVNTEIGFFVPRVWVTEGIRPGVVACSHHMGRWTVAGQSEHAGWSTALAHIDHQGQQWSLRQVRGPQPYESDDPDTARVWWTDAGVHQNLTFPVHPDPISGSHCWHQKVRITQAEPEDRYGDISVDTAKSREVFREWLALARPAPGPGGLRRPHWFLRPYRPDVNAYRLPEAQGTRG
ncbi:MAG TPA: molybdopterin-dependent oxidoreductase [Ktedonobacterales bacterium]|nr:molybdopterin-dependent oxidoreductase [Ktedonobacterales bacterium]